MKYCVKTKHKKPRIIKFPCIMKFTDFNRKNYYVLFNAPKKGMVIASDNSVGTGAVGYYSECWGTEMFQYLEEPITLEND